MNLIKALFLHALWPVVIIVSLCAAAPAFFAAMWSRPFLEEHGLGIFTLVFPALAIIVFFLTLWFLVRFSRYVIDDCLPFGDAAKVAWSEMRRTLAFVPVVGRWLTPECEEGERNKDDSP
jgi:hypothetical protein